MANKDFKIEYMRLFQSKIEEGIKCNYICDQQIRVLTEANQWLKEWKSLKEMDVPTSPEEKEKHNLHMDELRIQAESANEVFQMLDRMKDKSKRKLNEIDKKIEQFNKRHGLQKTE